MKKRSPFRYFKTSPEIIRFAVMLYVRSSLSLRNVEDHLHDHGIDGSHETVRFWRHRFGPMFASEIRKRRIEGVRSSRWRWHLDEVFMTGKLRSYGAAMKDLGLADRQETGRWGEQPSGEFTPSVPTTRTSNAPFPTDARFAEIRIRPRLCL